MNHHRVVFDITTKTHLELEEKYGIEIDYEYLTVFDPYTYTTYLTLQAWAASMDEEDDGMASFEKRSGKQRYEE